MSKNNSELPSGIEPNYLDYKSSASPAMLWKQSGKQKMGAWTSAFMIGVSNRSGQKTPSQSTFAVRVGLEPTPLSFTCTTYVETPTVYRW